jgi:hypothetical protein
VKTRAAHALLLVALAFAGSGQAQISGLGMSYVETKDLRLIYFDPLAYLAPHSIRTYTNSMQWQKQRFGWSPTEPTTILLKDLSDFGNASAGVAPNNRLVFDVGPQSRAFETFPASERMFSLMNHELVHIAQGDLSSAEDRRWRSLMLGKVMPRSQNPESLLYNYLTVPRFTAPRWYIEGGAVFMETWMGGGVGRAQGGYDEMVFRAMVRDAAPFPDPLELVSKSVRVDFQIGANAYLYGTRFLTYLAYQHSPEKVVAWIRRDEGSARYYADRFLQVFGLPLDQAWIDWIAFEKKFQQANLGEVRKNAITPEKRLVADAVGSVSRMFYDEATGTILAAFRYRGKVEHVGLLDTRNGGIKRLADIKRAMLYRVTSLAYDPKSATAFYTNDNLALRDLMALDLKTGESRMLLEDARIGEMAFNPADRSLIGIKHENGVATLVHIPSPYTRWFDIVDFPYEHVPYDLDISPDGKLLSASIGEVNGDQFLRVWDVGKALGGDLAPVSEFRFGQSVPESFVFSPDGKHLFGSSYYTGVSNIFRYEVASGKVDAVSNAESGLFRPVPLGDGKLLVLSYTAAGFVPAVIDAKPIESVSAIKFLGAEVVNKHPVVTKWQVPPPNTVDADALVVRRGEWIPLAHMGLDNAYPVLQGYKSAIGAGYQFNFADPLGFAKLGVTLAWTPDKKLSRDERAHFEINGEYLGWRTSVAWNRSDFYDMFGPTRRGRKGLAARFGYDDLIIWDEPRRLTGKYDLIFLDKIDVLPEAQNIGSAFSRLLTAEAGWYYTDYRRSIGGVDDEKGLGWSVVGRATRAKKNFIGLLRGNLDLGFDLPMPSSSIWSRTAVGGAGGDPVIAAANYYFGGFGNNYVDNGTIKRYHDHYALPGFALNQIKGRSFFRQMVEVNLPPANFASLGTQAFHATWARGSVFATALWTDPNRAALRKRYGSIGVQTDLRLSVLHWYDMTLSLGYALGYAGSKRIGDEFMVSLKIL